LTDIDSSASTPLRSPWAAIPVAEILESYRTGFFNFQECASVRNTQELRLITQRDTQLSSQSRKFTHSNLLYTAKFNKMMTGRRGTKLAQETIAYR
jgi:hypothetical protein